MTTSTPAAAPRATRDARKAKKRAFRAEMRWPRGDKLRRLGWATLAGVLTFLSFPFSTTPDTNLWPFAWLSLVPFMWALRGREGKPTTDRQGFWVGAWMGLVTNFGGFWWISEVLSAFGHLPGYVSWPLTALNAFYQGLMWAFVGLWWVRAARRGPVPIWKTAAIFTVVEWLYPMIFPWYLANSQYRFLPAIQIAELGGVMAITFTMVAFNAALFAVIDQRVRKTALPRRAALLAFGGTALVILYGVLRIAMVEGDVDGAEKFKLGLVEANIGIFEKQAKHLPPREQALMLHRNLLRHQLMSQELAKRGADLIVWPESSYFPLDDPFIKRKDQFALGLAGDGELFAWRDLGPDAAYEGQATFQWVPRMETPALPSGVKMRAVGAAREDAWAMAGDGGWLVVNGTAVATPTTSRLLAVALIEGLGHTRAEDGAPVTLWAAGEGGTLLRYEDKRAVVVPTGVTTALRAVVAGPGRTGWAVGDGGVALSLDGETARRVPLGTSADLTAVWMEPSGEGSLVAGRSGVLVFVDAAGRATPQTLPPGTPAVDFSGIAVDASGAVSVGGTGGVVLTQKGRAWTRDDLPAHVDIVSLTADASGELLAATADGRVFAKAARGWRETDAHGIQRLAPLPYVQARPLPRDVRYVQQSPAPLPLESIETLDPADDIRNTPEMERSAIQRGFTTPILLGALTWEDPVQRPGEPPKTRKVLYNTAVLIDDFGRVLGTYDKVFLLAFGEYMPFGETFPGLYDAFPTAGRFTAGKEVRTFHWGSRNLGIMICYEDIMAGFTAKLADLQPDIIINVTNDAWFGRTSEPYLHLALAVFRSVENRRMLVRSTNTGVSAMIDPTGRINAQTSIDGAETLMEDVPLMHGRTVYAAVGDVFAWSLLVLLVAEGLLAWKRRRAAAASAGRAGAGQAGAGGT
ncbi:MAG: apolipoprotein N-acyltransferase [Myxococcota bacterium]